MQPSIQHIAKARPVAPVEDTVHFIVSLAQATGFIPRRSSRQNLEQLSRIVKAFSVALETSTCSVKFEDAAAFSLEARAHRRPSTQADLRSYISRMCSYKSFAALYVREITISQCREMLHDCFGHSAHTFRKAQSVLHSIFNHAQRQQWCDFNPAKAILRPPVQEKRIDILTLDEIRHLIHTTNCYSSLRCMSPAVRLMTWCGVRPMEVRRLTWGDIDPAERQVYVERENSKTGGARAIPLRGGALLLCEQAKHKAPTERLAPGNWDRLWHSLRNCAGFTAWQNDALRHTFASMHLKRFHNLSLLQAEMGHRDSSLLQTRYLNLRGLSQKTASRFFKADLWG